MSTGRSTDVGARVIGDEAKEQDAQRKAFNSFIRSAGKKVEKVVEGVREGRDTAPS